MKNNRTPKLFRFIIERLLLPSPSHIQKPLSKFWLLVIIIFCIVLVVLALPPIINVILCSGLDGENKLFFQQNREDIGSWFSFFTITFEILTALLIGGSIYGQRLANRFKESLDNYEQARKNIIEGKRDALVGLVNILTDNIIDLTSGKSTKEILLIFFTLAGLAWQLRKVVFDDLPEFYKSYLWLMFYSSFPGGLYGLSAFVSFLILSLIKVCGLYMQQIEFVCT